MKFRDENVPVRKEYCFIQIEDATDHVAVNLSNVIIILPIPPESRIHPNNCMVHYFIKQVK